jgi:ribonucleotide reductase beta subunit family protein with ferritin-like domain
MGRPGLLQPPVENYIASLPSHERQVLNQVMAFTAAGDKKVGTWLREVIASGV